MAMDLEIIEALLEELNRQVNQAIDLVRGLRKGEVFGEPLPVGMRDSLTAQAKIRYNGLKSTFVKLTEEVAK